MVGEKGETIMVNRVFVPVTRASDPISSFEAEAKINTDTRMRQCQTLLKIIQDSGGGLVAGEIGEQTGFGMHITCRRLADLKNQGLARQGEPRVWEGSGRRQATWWPVVTQGELFQT